MARIQILELPTVYQENGTDETPFVLIIDEYEPAQYILGVDQGPSPSPWDGVAERIGARAILAFEETIDIPANQVLLEDGHTVQLGVETDLQPFRELADAAIAEAASQLCSALRNGRR